MRLETDSILNWVQVAARRADRFIIISPFFTLRDNIRTLLESIPRLEILVGDEFATNNPIPLMKLSELDSTDVRCIYRQQLTRRLHAKVFFAIENSGRCRVLVGSANFTVSGLTRNIEHAISLDSDCVSDREILTNIKQWIDDLMLFASEIDWENAKHEYEGATNPTFSYDDFSAYLQDQTKNYWVLKTSEGSTGRSRWEEFVKENVVSIGWRDVVEIMADRFKIEPNNYQIKTLRNAGDVWANRDERAGHPKHAANMLYCFTQEFAIGDRVILCRGYSSNQVADVRLYGLAIVNGNVVDHRNSDWWRLKRPSVIWRKNIEIPRDIFVNALQRESLLQTIHKISKREYEEFCRLIRDL